MRVHAPSLFWSCRVHIRYRGLCTECDNCTQALGKKAEISTFFRTMERRRLEAQHSKREIAWRRKRSPLTPSCTDLQVRRHGKKGDGQQTERREQRSRRSQRCCSSRRSLEKGMLATVWALLREPVSRGWRGGARGMRWTGIGRDRDAGCSACMTTCHTAMGSVDM